MTGFDLCGPLPTGTTVLEASAGTGKTYAIVGLATRFVAEGVADISQLLLVTFSRAATQELRERTRDRFTSTATQLADVETARSSTDDLVRYLAEGSAEDVAVRRQRLTRALSDFDAGTIATTHSFCQRMLDGLGIAGEREPDATFVESVDDLVTEVVHDLYLRAYSNADSEPPITLAEALQVARAAIGDRQAKLAPDSDIATDAGHRVVFARAARLEIERRKRAIGVRDFDDLLVLLHGVLSDPDHGDAACQRIRDRFRVVLVDEFQDTDPLQWDILRRTFHGSTTLVLVGDPKQAIYAFRGAEVLSYLDAVRLADNHHELTTNRRSDKGLIDALEYLYGGAALGHEEIVVHPVAAHQRISRFSGQTPFRLRHLPRTRSGPLNRSGFPAVGVLRDRVARDLAADIVRLLEGGAPLTIGSAERPVAPGDIAVLVRTRKQITVVRDALDKVGVPSVLAGGTSVFDTRAAMQWLWLLQALEQPHRADRVRLAALTPLLGWTADRLDVGGDDMVAEVGGQLRDLATLFAQAGFAAVFERLAARTRLEERLLAVESGERTLTDLRHLAQLLNRAAVEESFGLAALTRWLTERIKDPTSGSVADRSRRLDSDADAVQIATVHASKGLEFPIIYLPYAWDSAKNPSPGTLLLHDDAGHRILDVGGESGQGYRVRKQTHDQEEAGEDLRLLYVALTRAMCQVVAWWAPAITTAGSSLNRMILGRPPGTAGLPGRAGVPADSVASAQLSSWAAGAPQVISVESVDGRVGVPKQWAPIEVVAGSLAAARFDRALDPLWKRTSYSALTASAHDVVGVGSEAEQPEKTDEPEGAILGDQVVGGTPSPMNALPFGAAFGTLVHEVLEVVDTSAADLAGELHARCVEAVAARLADVDPAALATALLPVLHTPLGFGSLAEIAPADRLAELDFELPLAGGDDPSPITVTVGHIAALLREHLDADDPLASYPDLLATLEPTPLRGYLTGSIDAVLRIPGPAYVVVDYKTNRLAQGDLTVLHYARERMAQEMLRAHYPLQALLYAVALHRYLRWRQPDYDPAVHLGGVQYLFVRGMVGPETPPGCGVFEWKPPAALVIELSDLLAGNARSAAT